MEFSIDRTYFLEKLSGVSRAVAVHSAIPALTGILIQVKPDCIVLTGSDNELTIQTTIYPGEISLLKIEQTGSISVEAKTLTELLRKMNGTVLKIETTDTIVHLSTTDGSFNLVGMPAYEYPFPDLKTPEIHLQLPAKLIAEASEQTGYAASEKDARAILLGINLRIEDGQFYATATDSFRLARKKTPLESEDKIAVTVPKSNLQEVVHSFDKNEVIDVYLNRRKIQFISDKTLVQSQLLEGTYPDADRIIPTRFSASLKCSARELEGILNRATIYTSSPAASGNISPVRMDINSSKVTLEVLGSQIGNCTQTLESAAFEGEPLTLSFNANLVLQALKALGSGSDVLIEFTGVLSPFKISSPEDETLTMIVVPIRGA